MASSSGNSSGSTQINQNSGSEEDLQVVMDQRKRKRMQSNRESARRSRLRKQKHLDELMQEVTRFTRDNNQLLTSINITNQHLMTVEAENSILKAQFHELSQRLDSLNDILRFMSNSSGIFDTNHHDHDQIHVGGGINTNFAENNSFMNNNPMDMMMMYHNQPIMAASADMFHY
ncbi:hypothetical protein LWI28_017640 [Acer negundo]|uniref:BZIP domain-containing protein n=1 Tax=Acer negundo TaxID=4023 RepID=A0AAD5P7E6_ACENE|nr:hypothetical protein LWI28_017640 [Acer negundo]KAK4859760.1 hypothetical protein QYF36_011235 [Acer negundo]